MALTNVPIYEDRLVKMGGNRPAMGCSHADSMTLETAPKRPHGVEVFVGAPASFGQFHSDRSHLGFEVAPSDAKQEPTFAEHIKARSLLGQDDGVALGQDEDPGSEFDPLGCRRYIGQLDQRVEYRVRRLHRRVRHARAGQHHMIADHHDPYPKSSAVRASRAVVTGSIAALALSP
jgi:hypothetical protein